MEQVGDAKIPAFGGRASYTGILVDGGVAANNPTLLGLAFMQKIQEVMLKLFLFCEFASLFALHSSVCAKNDNFTDINLTSLVECVSHCSAHMLANVAQYCFAPRTPGYNVRSRGVTLGQACYDMIFRCTCACLLLYCR